LRSNSTNKKVLVITFGYPPRAGSGIQRILKITNLLPDCGWDPIVLTLPRWGNEIEDMTWEKAISPKVKIHRVASLDPMRILNMRKVKNSRLDFTTIKTPLKNKHNRGCLDYLKSIYHSLLIPDRSILWIPGAVIFGIFLVLRYRPQLIFTTSGPFGVSIVGLLLSRLTAIPLVADYRDPWTENPLRKLEGFRRKVEKVMEKACINTARGITGVTESITAYYRQLSDNSRKQKFITLTNGFESADFEKSYSEEQDGIFRIVYTGLFYGEQTPEYLFKALKLASDKDREFRDGTKLIIAGKIQDNYQSELRDEPLLSMVDYRGYIPHDEVLKLMARANVLYLYIYKDGVNVYSSKLFEYLASLKYILASIPINGIAAELIKQYDAGLIVNPDDVDGLSYALLDCFRKFKNNELQIKHTIDDVQEFSWDRIVEKIAGLFNQVLENN